MPKRKNERVTKIGVARSHPGVTADGLVKLWAEAGLIATRKTAWQVLSVLKREQREEDNPKPKRTAKKKRKTTRSKVAPLENNGRDLAVMAAVDMIRHALELLIKVV
jgi:hypothetical protein